METERPAHRPNAAAIIAEYNPFHLGHAYQIREARRLSGADYIIIIMSGCFVQRGGPALLDKYVRTRLALLGGADLVLELPCAAACGSAPYFAGEAVRILDRLGVVKELWFGSEAGRTEPFLALADLLTREPEAYRQALRRFIRQGDSFPLARRKALEENFSAALFPAGTFELQAFLEAPNNILGLEYCAALNRRHSSIRPRTLKRAGSGYHDRDLSESFSSATALRQRILAGAAKELENQFPPEIWPELQGALLREGCLEDEDFSLPLKCLLLDSSLASLSSYLPEDLARRALNLRGRFLSFSQFTDLLKTRNRTRTSVQRSLLRLLLRIPVLSGENNPEHFSGTLSCRTLTDEGRVRILGFRKTAAPLLSEIKRQSSLALEARPADLPEDAYQIDFRASNLYEAVRSHKARQPFRDEKTRQPVIL